MNPPFKAKFRARLPILLAVLFLITNITVSRIDNRLMRTVASKSPSVQPVEETVKLTPARMTTSKHHYTWVERGPNFVVAHGPEDTAGTMTVGYEHYYRSGTPIIGSDEGGTWVNRGAMWFDLSGIASKAPPLHVFVESAMLRYKTNADSGTRPDCDTHRLLIAHVDWSKGYDGLVPGDEFSTLLKTCPSCGLLDVGKVLNNWLRGEGHGGSANYGFVVAGNTEEDRPSGGKGHWLDNDACWTRYSDVSLTVTYKYDQPKSSGLGTITPPPAGSRTNVALATNGGVASASSLYGAAFAAAAVNDGDRTGVKWAAGGGWDDGTPGVFPDWVQVNFAGKKSISEINLFMVPDDVTNPSEPSETLTFTKYGLTSFQVLYWGASGWTVVPGGNVKSNNLVVRKFLFSPPIFTDKVRVLTLGSPDGYSRLLELEAYSP
jgi:hypothetical protein